MILPQKLRATDLEIQSMRILMLIVRITKQSNYNVLIVIINFRMCNITRNCTIASCIV